MTTIDDFYMMEKAIQKKQREHDKSTGQLESLISRIKKDHGVDSLEEANKLLEKLKVKEEKLRKEIEQDLEAVEKEYGEKLT